MKGEFEVLSLGAESDPGRIAFAIELLREGRRVGVGGAWLQVIQGRLVVEAQTTSRSSPEATAESDLARSRSAAYLLLSASPQLSILLAQAQYSVVDDYDTGCVTLCRELPDGVLEWQPGFQHARRDA